MEVGARVEVGGRRDRGEVGVRGGSLRAGGGGGDRGR